MSNANEVARALADQQWEINQQRKEAMADNTKWVTAYEVTRHYGGPEEGGWWYDRYDPIESNEVADEEAQATRKMLRERYADREHGDIGSVLGGVEVQVLVEDEREEFAVTSRPHYE